MKQYSQTVTPVFRYSNCDEIHFHSTIIKIQHSAFKQTAQQDGFWSKSLASRAFKPVLGMSKYPPKRNGQLELPEFNLKSTKVGFFDQNPSYQAARLNALCCTKY